MTTHTNDTCENRHTVKVPQKDDNVATSATDTKQEDSCTKTTHLKQDKTTIQTQQLLLKGDSHSQNCNCLQMKLLTSEAHLIMTTEQCHYCLVLVWLCTISFNSLMPHYCRCCYSCCYEQNIQKKYADQSKRP